MLIAMLPASISKNASQTSTVKALLSVDHPLTRRISMYVTSTGTYEA